MRELRLTLRFRLDKALVRTALLLLCGAVIVPELASESVSLTAYYPAPTATYTRVVSTAEAYLNKDGGKVRVGAATAPTYMFDVSGTMRSTDLVSADNAGATGGFVEATTGVVLKQTGCVTQSWQVGGQIPTCGPNKYATYLPGLLYNFNSGITPAVGSTVLCCTCPAGLVGACPR